MRRATVSEVRRRHYHASSFRILSNKIFPPRKIGNQKVVTWLTSLSNERGWHMLKFFFSNPKFWLNYRKLAWELEWAHWVWALSVVIWAGEDWGGWLHESWCYCSYYYYNIIVDIKSAQKNSKNTCTESSCSCEIEQNKTFHYHGQHVNLMIYNNSLSIFLPKNFFMMEIEKKNSQ